MADLHLLRPMALWLLLLLPMLAYWLARQGRQGSHWRKVLPSHLQAAMLATPGQEPNPRRPWALFLGLFLAILALAGPSWDKQEVPVFQLEHGQVLVLDLSDSMWATDLKPNRLVQARFKAIDLLRQQLEGEIALVVYGGDAFALTPLTEDRSTLLNLLPSLSPEIMPVRGSNLPAALRLSDQLLQDAGYQQGEILLITDGINTEYLDDALSLANDQPWSLRILALGSEAGAPMKTPEGELVRDRAGAVALAKTRYDLLQRLADASGGVLVPYRADNDDIEQLLSRASPLEEHFSDSQRQDGADTWRDQGGRWLWLALLPLAWGLRQQGLLSIAALVLSGSLLVPQAQAAWWQNADQQGKAHYDAGRYDEAAQAFDDPQWRGSALYQAGDYQGALDAFSQGDDATALYNQGNALAQLGQLEPAKDRYRQALEKDPGFVEAQANLDLLEQIPPQESPQEDQQGEQEPDNQQEQQAPGEDGQQGDQDSQPDSASDSDQQESQQGQQGEQHDPAQSESSSQDGEQPKDQAKDSSGQPSPQDGSGQDQASDTPPSPRPDQQEPAPEQDPSETDATPAAPSEPSDEPSSPSPATAAQPGEGEPGMDPEQYQQLLQQVPDDPARLLRNKMQWEYQKRRQNGTINTERTQW